MDLVVGARDEPLEQVVPASGARGECEPLDAALPGGLAHACAQLGIDDEALGGIDERRGVVDRVVRRQRDTVRECVGWPAPALRAASLRSCDPQFDLKEPEIAREFVTRLGVDLQVESCPPEVNALGRTITCWRHKIAAWHQAFVSNEPTEATT